MRTRATAYVLTAFASLAIAAIALPDVAYGQAGRLDPTFNADGKVRTDIAGFDAAWGVAIDGAGRIIAVGQAAAADAADFAIVRYTPTGALDTTFGPEHTGKVLVDFGFTDVARGVALDGQGRIVVVGWSDEGEDVDWAVARLLPDGTLDQTFGPDHNGMVRTGFGGDNDRARAVAIDAFNRIVVVGDQQDDISDESDFGIIRLNSDGTVDTTFDGDGLLTLEFGENDTAHAVAIDEAGRILVAGDSGPPFQIALARIHENGGLDATFGSGGGVVSDVTSGTARGIALDGLGRIVVAGSGRDPVADGIRMVVLRYNTDGTPDNLFGSGGKVFGGEFGVSLGPNAFLFLGDAFAVAVDAPGRIVAAGFFGTAGDRRFAIARYDDLGRPDTTFWTDGELLLDAFSDTPTLDEAHAMAIDGQGRVVVAGQTGDGLIRDFALARMNSDPTADLRITKTASVTSAVPGDVITFSLRSDSLGPDSARLVTVTDEVPAGLTVLTCQGGFVPDVCTGTGNSRRIEYDFIGPGSPRLGTITASVDAGVPDGTVLTNTAVIASASTADPNAANNTSSVSIVIRNKADLLLTQKVKKLSKRRLAYTLTVRNNGPYEARQIVLNHPMPNGTHFLNVEGGDWSCTPLPPGSVGTLACVLPFLPSSGATTATLVLEVKATAPGSVDIVSTATVSAATHDPNPANNTATLVSRVSGK